MVVVGIAQERLSPEVRAEAERLIDLLAEHEPRFDDLVTASVWLDAIRSQGWRAFDEWHYLDLPYNADGLSTLPSTPDGHAVEAVRQAMATLSRPEAPDLAKAFMLRVLIHVVADLHQPLHCTSRFTLALPGGDRGGNDFLLTMQDGTPGNLHRLWDGTLGLLPDLEANAEGAARVPELAARLLAAVPESQLEKENWRDPDPEVWTREGFRLARSVVYVGIQEGRMPSEVYQVKGQLVAQRRLVVAGFRLAALLESALGPSAGSHP